MNHNKFAKTLLASALAFISVESTAQTLEEVVVTAQKREQSLQDVPIAITAFGESDVERLNAKELGDLQYSSPNLYIDQSQRNMPQIGLRGISDQSRNPGYDNRVSVYVDGIFAGRSGTSNQATLDLERVEVLRGPQGTLFGKNTVAGAISMTTKKPSDTFNGFLKAEGGDYSYRSMTGMVTGPISDTLSAKIIVNDTQRDGHIKNLANDRLLNGIDLKASRVQLRWLASDKTEVNFSYDKSESGNDNIGQEASPDNLAPNPHEVNFDTVTLNNVDQHGFGLTIDHELDNGFTLTSITGKRVADMLGVGDEDFTPYPIAFSNTQEHSEHTSQEIRLASPADDKMDYVVGAYYIKQTNESLSSARTGPYGFFVGLPNNAGVELPGVVDVKSFALFAHGNYMINDQLQLTAGLRYTKEDKDVNFTITDTSGLFTNDSISDDRSANDVSPKIGLNYFVNDDLMFYGSYSKAFKSGGWNIDFLNNFDNIAFDDEKVDNYELGMKSTLADGSVRLNAAIFRADYSDYQVFQFVPQSNGTTIFTLTNAGEVRSQGFEMDLTWAATENLSLWSSYGYTDATFLSFKDGGGVGVDYDGNAAPFAPKKNISAGVEYRYGVGFGDIVAQANYSYRDDFYAHPNNLEVNHVGAYELFNARLGLESADGHWSVFAWAKNLNDTLKMRSRSVSFFGVSRANYTDPKMVGLSLQYNFGEQ